MFESIVVPDKPQTLVSSTSVIGYSYDDKAYQLVVWYKGKKPSVYRYLMVLPPVVSSIFDSGGSIGLKLRDAVKGLPHMKLR
jgi:hypothetical protein